jgi:hypothetical protein
VVWKSLVGAVCALGLAAPGAGQSANISPPQAPTDEIIAALPLEQRFHTLLMNGRYLDAFEQIETTGLDKVSEELHSSYRQQRPVLDGFFFQDPAAPPLPPPDPAELAAYEGAEAEDAIRAIVERARDRRVVIVNEAHDSPRDRAFILKLAAALEPLGFTYFAAEAFMNVTPEFTDREMGWLESAGYPRFGTGTYTVDPMFGYLLRRAMALGYRPVAYEAPFRPEDAALSREQQIVAREQAQAENLAQALAAAGPDAKILIHVGYAHAAERPLPPGETEWMAARLARLTGLDPLTIDQTDLGEAGYSPRARALHRALAVRVGERPVVFMKDGTPLATGQIGQATDLQVVHPAVTAIDGRPGWLRDTGRRAVPVPAELLPAEGRRLVQAFVAGEADDAVPLDQALVMAGQEPPVLYVPDGVELRWAVQD